MKPCGKHSPAVRKKMLPFVLVPWPTVRGCRPKVFRHYQIGTLTLLGPIWLGDCLILGMDLFSSVFEVHGPERHHG